MGLALGYYLGISGAPLVVQFWFFRAHTPCLCRGLGLTGGATPGTPLKIGSDKYFKALNLRVK